MSYFGFQSRTIVKVRESFVGAMVWVCIWPTLKYSFQPAAGSTWVGHGPDWAVMLPRIRIGHECFDITLFYFIIYLFNKRHTAF